MTELTVRPMTPAEFVLWQEELSQAYADEQVAAGNWPAEGALERSRRENAESLPQGLNTPDMLVLNGVLADGTVIGRVWVALRHPRGVPDCAFLNDIEVVPEHRGQGLGRALLEAAERAVVAHGVGALALNVFGQNTTAQALYDSAGYQVTSRQMRKPLR